VHSREIDFRGHHGLELVAGDVTMVVVTSVGPRIAWFGRTGGENLLFWDDEGAHQQGAWRMYGGHRLWLTRPLADESDETFAPDNEPCRIERTRDGVSVCATPSGSPIERSLSIGERDGRWTIRHGLRNTGELLWSGGAWALTCTLPHRDSRYRIPLGGMSKAWDVATILIPMRWGTHTSRLDDDQFTFSADAMEFRAQNDEAKRMVLAPHGRIELRDHRGVFRKTSPFEIDARYPLATNLAVYLAPRAAFVELESMSPQRTLYPGDALAHLETWTLDSSE
jgi:hypothetical protein